MNDSMNNFKRWLQPLLPVAAIVIPVMLALWGFGWNFLPEVGAIFLAILIASILKTQSVRMAVDFRCKFCIGILVRLGADVNARGNYGFTPLHMAAEKGDTQIIPILVEAGADANAKGNGLRTPLHRAVEKGQNKVIFELALAGADPDAKDRMGWTPLHRAAQRQNNKTVCALANVGAKLNELDKINQTPLDLAKSLGNWDIVKEMKKLGCKTRAELEDAAQNNFPLRDD